MGRGGKARALVCHKSSTRISFFKNSDLITVFNWKIPSITSCCFILLFHLLLSLTKIPLFNNKQHHPWATCLKQLGWEMLAVFARSSLQVGCWIGNSFFLVVVCCLLFLLFLLFVPIVTSHIHSHTPHPSTHTRTRTLCVMKGCFGHLWMLRIGHSIHLSMWQPCMGGWKHVKCCCLLKPMPMHEMIKVNKQRRQSYFDCERYRHRQTDTDRQT